MPEDIMDRLNRLANAGRKPPKQVEEAKIDVFANTRVKDEPKASRGHLMALLDDADRKYNNGKVRW